MKISISKQYLGDYTVLQYSVCSTVLYITTKTKPSHFSWTYIQYLYTFGKKEDADMFWLKIVSNLSMKTLYKVHCPKENRFSLI